MLVLKPSEKTFADLVGLAKEGKTFDGKLMNNASIRRHTNSALQELIRAY